MKRVVRLLTVMCGVTAIQGVAAEHRVLLPRPQNIQYGAGHIPIQGLSIALAANASTEDWFAAGELSKALAAICGSEVPVRGGKGSGPAIILQRTGDNAPLAMDSEKTGPDSRESYRVKVTPQGVEVTAVSSAGLFYAAQTLRQLAEGGGRSAVLPEAEIQDWPSLAYRGVMMDLSHGPLPTEDEVKRQIDFLARWKGNQYYFYSEATIEMKGYPLVNPGARYSQEQVRSIIDYARLRHVDIVPCLEFYGHLHDLFRIERYSNLSALPYGGEINPLNPEIQAILKDWLEQMTALFPSPWLHLGLDEPWELERGASRMPGGADPKKIYIEHLKRMAEIVRQRGKRVLFWADVNSGANLFNRYPEMASQLPSNVIAVPWNYDAKPDFSDMLAPLAKVKVPQVIGTGTWGWDEVSPDFLRTFANIDRFLVDGRKYGILGMINTDWSDAAQLLFRATLPGVAYGAAASWQTVPMDRNRFFAEYAALSYSSEAAPEVAAALEAMASAQQKLITALGDETTFRFWDDPFRPAVVQRAEKGRQDLKRVRVLAEDAQERLLRAMEREPEGFSLPSLLVCARMLDYAGMKYIYATDIAGFFRELGPRPKAADLEFYFWTQIDSRNHSRVSDLMDTISGLRDDYRKAWEAEYTPYRMQAALGRWDAEYEYWRRVQARCWEFRRQFKEGDTLPPLESFSPWR